MAKKGSNAVCEKTAGLLALYHFGELGADEAAFVREHVDGCPACRAELNAIEGMLGGISRHEPSQFAVSRSVNRVKARIARPSVAAMVMRFVPVALAASIAVLAVAIYYNIGAMDNVAKFAMNTAPRPAAVGTPGMEAPGAAADAADTAVPADVNTNADEDLLLALLDGPPAEPEGALVPYSSTGEPVAAAPASEDAPPIYALVAMEPLSDADVIHQLDMLEDYDTLAEIQNN